MTQIDAIQKKFLAKLEQKCVGNKSLTSVLRKAFRDVDLDNDGVISFPEWARVVEVAGSVLTDQESEFLFYFWDSMAGQREPQGLISVAVATNDLMGNEKPDADFFGLSHQPGAATGKAAAAPTAGSGDRLGFGGGAYDERPAAEDMTPREYVPPPEPFRPPPSTDIFGAGPPAPERRESRTNRSNASSVPGGIFGEDDTSAPKGKKMYDANRSSVPGGIFG